MALESRRRGREQQGVLEGPACSSTHSWEQRTPQQLWRTQCHCPWLFVEPGKEAALGDALVGALAEG